MALLEAVLVDMNSSDATVSSASKYDAEEKISPKSDNFFVIMP